jgi:hypothetical protein
VQCVIEFISFDAGCHHRIVLRGIGGREGGDSEMREGDRAKGKKWTG